MNEIKILDNATINKIAAGEVIERPQSIVKECIDNSLDAGASRISIAIKDGGIGSIIIEDNGKGIYKDDLPLCLTRHATSKIERLEDIYSTSTMGFRGEALASICHVSELEITSRHQNAPHGYRLYSNGDTTSSLSEANREVGTTISIKNVFANIPVRRKFLKRASTEFSAIFIIVQQYALLWPEIDFILTHEGSERLNTSGISDGATLLQLIYGKTLKGKLIKIDEEIGGVKVDGWISDPTLTFSNRSKQLVGINGRPIQSPILHKIITDAYRDVIPYKRFPLVLLRIFLPRDTLDVNIHPKKSEIKFLHPEMLFSVLPKLFSRAFGGVHSDLMALRETGRQEIPGFPGEQIRHFGRDPEPTYNIPRPNSWIPNQIGDDTQNGGSTELQISENHQQSAHQVLPQHLNAPLPTRTPSPTLFSTEERHRLDVANLDYLQLYDTYIVLNAKNTLWLLDQHAVHERVLYETFKTHESADQIPTQPLLVPIVIDVTPDLMAVYDAISDQLPALGMDIGEFGPNQLVVREIPSHLLKSKISNWLVNLLESCRDFEGEGAKLPDRKDTLQMRACKAAIKAGMRLETEEVHALLEQFLNSPSNFTCPHGRPLFISFNKEEIERLFLRR